MGNSWLIRLRTVDGWPTQLCVVNVTQPCLASDWPDSTHHGHRVADSSLNVDLAGKTLRDQRTIGRLNSTSSMIGRLDSVCPMVGRMNCT